MGKTNLFRTTWIALSIVLVLSLLAVAVPQPVQAATDATCSKTVTVKEGQTLRRIAKLNDVRLWQLARANDIDDPYAPLTVGDKLCIPGDEVSFGTKSYWTATFNTKGEVKLIGQGFKKEATYFLKVRETADSKQFKLARLKTTKNGEFGSTKYLVPKDLRDNPYIFVCLKDGISDANQCKQIWRY